jgi:hypothetical protein
VTDGGPDPAARKPGHEERVQDAFDSLNAELGERLDADARGAVDRLRDAAAQKDVAQAREELAQVRERHGWLWEELSKHPQIATIIDELALWGF